MTTDFRLEAFWSATDEAEAHRALARLMGEVAGPLIAKILRTKFAALAPYLGAGWRWDFEDACSCARGRLISRLVQLRAAERGRGVEDLAAYAAKVAYAAWSDYNHARCPGLTKVRHRLQYVLENRTRRKDFALRRTEDGSTWCALAGANPGAEAEMRRARLSEQPRRAAQEAFPWDNPKALGLAELSAGLLGWVGGPVELHALAAAVAEVLEVLDEGPEAWAAGSPGLVDAQPGPHDAAKWREYLSWLAAEVARLPLGQRTAFLLRSSATVDFEFYGVLSLRQLAALLEQPAPEVAGWWTRLPLDDRAIGAILGLERQQVINLRRLARETLGRRWHAGPGRN